MRTETDCDLIVIGGGPAGIIAALAAADQKARVILVERGELGGASLHTGSVPSKALIRTANTYARLARAGHYGAVTPPPARPDFPKAMQRVRNMRERIRKLYGFERMRDSGVELMVGEARFVSTDAVEIGERTMRFEKAIIATGASPQLPQIDGLTNGNYLTSDTVFELRSAPQRLLVVGGGPLGCELAQAFCRLGAAVTIAQDDPKFLPREERDAAQILSESMARDGVEIHLNTRVVAVRDTGGTKLVSMQRDDVNTRIEVDQILVGTNRLPNVADAGLEAAGVDFGADGIAVDDFLRTSNRRIFAAGDCCMAHKFTHTAAASARIAVANALGRGRRRFSRLVIPWCTYTDPEIAHVGMQVVDARLLSIPVKTITVLMHDVDRAIVDADEDGFLKVHIRDGTDQILGATIVASRAGDLINEITLAMQAKIGLSLLSNVLHTYPTQALSIKMAADAFMRERRCAK